MSKYTLFILLALPFISCDEQKRAIIPFVPEGDRVILLEEFTGKGCTNCPKGSREIENLLLQFPENLVAVSIHAGFFANPENFPIGQYDLRTDEGEFLYGYIGSPLGYPSGSVNRTPVGSELQLSLNQWGSAISQLLQEEQAAEIILTTEYNATTRELKVETTNVAREAISGEIRLSIMLTESGIVDAQDDVEAGGIVLDYVHRHVLRDMLTPAAGEVLATNFIQNQSVSKSYTTILPANWVAEEMDVIAFISVVNGNSFPVLQAARAHVME